MSITSICQHCKTVFVPIAGTKGLYCSRDCYKVAGTIATIERNRLRYLATLQNYNSNPKLCIECNQPLPYANRKGKFCNHSCSASYTNKVRGPKSIETIEKLRKSMQGRKIPTEIVHRSILNKGQIPGVFLPNTKCQVCHKDTNTKYRKTCSKACYSSLVIQNSRSNPNCGGQKHTHRSKIINIKGEVFAAESSYEVRLADILNRLEVHWVRPKFFWYEDETGSTRRYYPDFYLPDYDIYLDPKNDYLIKTDIDKINRTAEQNNIFIVVLGEAYISIDSVQKMVGDRGTAPLLPACKAGTLLLS